MDPSMVTVSELMAVYCEASKVAFRNCTSKEMLCAGRATAMTGCNSLLRKDCDIVDLEHTETPEKQGRTKLKHSHTIMEAGASVAPHCVSRHMASGKAFADLMLFAQPSKQALSPQAHLSMHDCPAAHDESLKQSVICLEHLLSAHWHLDGQAVWLQSGIAAASANIGISAPHCVSKHMARGKAFADLMLFAQPSKQALSPQAHLSMHDCPAAHDESLKQS